MKAPQFTLATVICATLAVGPSVSAQVPARPPTIYSVTLDASAGVLTITGVGFGRDPVVIVDGQPAVVLPGASDTLLLVQAPAALVTAPGTYRLTVVDPVRQMGDGFVVASSVASVGGAGGLVRTESGGQLDSTAPSRKGARGAAAENRAEVGPDSGRISPYLIEDGLLFNTAVGAGALASNTTGTANMASGFFALFNNTTGYENTASGASSLQANTTGVSNTASGTYTLAQNTTGNANTVSGTYAMFSNRNGYSNTISGARALYYNLTGSNNTASGYGALYNTTGYSNTAIGVQAGSNVTTGSHNVFLGAEVRGTSADTNAIRIGLPFDSGTGAGQNQTFIAGIRGTTVTGGEAVYIDANGKLGSGPVVVGANSVGSSQVIDESLTAADLAPNSVGRSELLDGAVTVAKVAFDYAASMSEGGPAIDVACVGCVSASEVSFSFASLGANTFTGTQTIGTGHLDLAPSTATAGNITKSGVPFLHNIGTQNTFLGMNAGNLTVAGSNNAAVGSEALRANTFGSLNTAIGDGALYSNTTGGNNTASGRSALAFNTTGHANTACGVNGLVNNTTGLENTACGYQALRSNTTGGRNVAFGSSAGRSAATGSYNVFLGADVAGTAADTNTIRIGLPYSNGVGQNQTFIAGIHGATLTGSATAVYIDANGQLGTMQPPVPPPTGGSGGAGVSGPPTLPQQVQAQQAINEELRQRSQAQQATIEHLQTIIADLHARLARLEVAGAGRR